ncbi:MAG: hypothetical protein ABWZ80_00755 [Beijerinckiaceae bacterium]
MTIRMGLVAFALLAAIGAGAAPANAGSIEDCEKISAWDAYNKCLADFGPKRGERMRSAAASRDGGSRYERRRSYRHPGYARRKNGRAYAVFDVSPSRSGRRWR